ncbi:MerR family transcriptional regulator [Deinococcus sp. AJ005]|uniref:MerR family transcriptional regulator n=1 Tax=Deinococcus sp. AJ005 TaxID=2652443 RepID=UPI00125CBE98|nr:helix-turn-helix domain-containing protein [Deinococcus sp. AJ005]QFP76048.1 MerR family transcriptional regulator [Deinococcus sp. AJ005]
MTPTNPTASMTISAFAGASRLSLKALRLYDELGLLPPEWVDPDNGYRHYSHKQLPQARLIGLLRQLGLSLGSIRAVLDAPAGQQPDLIRGHWTQAEIQHTQRRELARYVLRTLKGEPPMTQHFNVQQRHVPAQQIATLSRRLRVDELPGFIEQQLKALPQQIMQAGATVAGIPFVIYHGQVNADNDGPVEVCVPYSGSLIPTGGLTLREAPAHAEAYVTLSKAQFSFPSILEAYDAVADYASAHGENSSLSPREVYPHDWAGLKDSDPAGDVAWPFVPQQG